MSDGHIVGRCNWCNKNTSQEHISPITFHFEPSPQFVCGPDCGTRLNRAIASVGRYHKVSSYAPYLAAAVGLTVLVTKHISKYGMAMGCLFFLACLGALTLIFPTPPISLVRSIKTKHAIGTMRYIGAAEVVGGILVYFYMTRFL